MTPRPSPGKDYRILAVEDGQHTGYVGRLITPSTVALAAKPGDMWRMEGRVHGIPGTITLTCAVQKNSGNCLCRAYDFPHSRTKACT